jgi:hypothetical protein
VGSSSPNPPPGDADPPAGDDDPLAAAAAELYGADPQDFTERRKTLAAAAKAGGDATAARQIAALRKPTRAAWVVNRLARTDPGAPARLADLAAALRDAEQTRDGPRLRELSAARGRLIDTLTSQALTAADVADPAAGLRDEVSATLTAALADPEVAAGFAAGTLTRAAEWAGFGLALSGAEGAGDAAPAESAQAPTPLEEGRALKAKKRGQEGLPAGERERREDRAAEARLRRERLAEERALRLAEEAAEGAAQRRKVFEDSERAVASATAAATDAVATEDRLEMEVRALEERLTRTRAELADARLQARRAEAAERKARRTLEHLPRPDDE